MKKKQTFGKSHVPLSPAVRAGDFVFVSGQVPTGADGKVVAGSMEEQTTQVLENVKAALALAGAAMEDVVKCTVIITDTAEFATFNKVYTSYFPKEQPARTTIVAKLVIDIKVEIEAVAYKPA